MGTLHVLGITGFCARSSDGLERLTTDQEAGGSSPPGRVNIKLKNRARSSAG